MDSSTSLIHNDVKKNKMYALVWRLAWVTIGKKFDRSYLSEEGRYRILTRRYGYKVTDRTTI